jgi:hypothetical protein
VHYCKLYFNCSHVGKKILGFIIYENKKLMQFENFHPTYNSKAFFSIFYYTRSIFFHDAKDLFSENNIELSRECQIRGFLHNIESSYAYLMQYANPNLFEN